MADVIGDRPAAAVGIWGTDGETPATRVVKFGRFASAVRSGDWRLITIQSALLVLLGVLIAALITFVVGPAYRARVVRLTTDRLKQEMPLTEAEIKADKDRLRADYAIRIHKQALALEEARGTSARMTIDLNLRDAQISELERRGETLTARLEESDNARNVLEQTIKDRLPRVEHRLAEAKKLIFQRDRDIATLTAESEKTLRALDEAMQINSQQRAEVARYQALAVNRGSTGHLSLSDPKFDAEVALKSEISALREQSRDQAALISRLQATLTGASGTIEAAQHQVAKAIANNEPDTEIDRVKRNLRVAEDAARPGTIAPVVPADKLQVELRQLRARTEDQAAEISRLTAALKVYDAGEGDLKTFSVKDSRIAMKARLGSIEAEAKQQAETIQKLRSEVASANERLARQAAHFMEEMKRLGAGTLPASGPTHRRGETGPARRSLVERVSQVNPARASGGGAVSPPRAANDEVTVPPKRDTAAAETLPLAAAEGAERPAVAVAVPAERSIRPAALVVAPAAAVASVDRTKTNGQSATRVRGVAAQIRALTDPAVMPAQAEVAKVSIAASNDAGREPVSLTVPAEPAPLDKSAEAPRRSRLLDRIADLSKTT